jgi:transposase-like protein
VLSYLDFPEQHRSKLHSTNPLERLNCRSLYLI